MLGVPIADEAIDGSEVLPMHRLDGNSERASAMVKRRGLEGVAPRRYPVMDKSGATTARRVGCRRCRNVDAFDGLLVGELVDDALHFRGVVEWGYRAHDVVEILREAQMFTRRTSPFVDLPRMRNAVWLEPRLRAEVSYAEIVGGRLRAPSWRGLIAR